MDIEAVSRRIETLADVAMIADGRRLPTESTFDVINPATEAVLVAAPNATRDQADAVMASAEAAYLSWKRDDDARRAAMRAAADLLLVHADDLGLLLTAEQGKPVRDSVAEVTTAVQWLRWYADLELDQPEIVEDSAVRRIAVYRRPLGPTVAITAWNFPIQMAVKKLAQALRPGNTVVVKPSPYTPLATLRMVEILQEVFPPGVVNAVSGGAELGSWLTEHPLTRKITFTGSTPVGKLVAAAAVPDLKRVTLELGGNDAAIVLDDADPATVAVGIFDRAFVNCGQTCAAIKRVYVPDSLYDDVVGALTSRAAAAVVGNGLEPDTDYGPLNNRAQLDIVAALVDDAVASGGRVTTGGPDDRSGFFYRPAIVADVKDEVRLVAEEQFGPALPVLSYSDLDDAVARANDSQYGLGGSVWTSDPDRGAQVAGELESGTVWVNTHATTLASQPFAGAKWSGIGVENGRWGMQQFTQLQAIHTAR